MLYFEKNREIILFRILTMVYENTKKIMSIGSLIMEKQAFKKIENVVVFVVFYFQNKNSWHLQFSITQIFRLMFIIFEYSIYIDQLLLKLRPSNLLFRFTWYRWQQLNNRQRKTAVNFLIYFLRDIINSNVWWKCQVFWHPDLTMTAHWNFCKIEQRGHFIGSFCDVCGTLK